MDRVYSFDSESLRSLKRDKSVNLPFLGSKMGTRDLKVEGRGLTCPLGALRTQDLDLGRPRPTRSDPPRCQCSIVLVPVPVLTFTVGGRGPTRETRTRPVKRSSVTETFNVLLHRGDLEDPSVLVDPGCHSSPVLTLRRSSGKVWTDVSLHSAQKTPTVRQERSRLRTGPSREPRIRSRPQSHTPFPRVTHTPKSQTPSPQ